MSSSTAKLIQNARSFAASLGLKSPILLGPMAGACPVSLSVAVANSGGMGACGALLMKPEAIIQWADSFRAQSDGSFQLNLWIPDVAPNRDPIHENELRAYLNDWGPEVKTAAASSLPPDFASQCDALIEIEPIAISSIMGVFDPDYVARMKAKGIKWIANVSTVKEAKQAEASGADIIVAKGLEAAGGHTGAFNPDDAMRSGAGLMSLVPAIVDAVDLPIVATGGISDARTALAALMLGASAVQIGTGFLRSPEAGIAPAWADAIGKAWPEDTIVTRAFSGRAGRSIATKYTLAMEAPDTPEPAPYPVQRGLTQVMRDKATKDNNIDCIQAWAGQSAHLVQSKSAAQITQDLWEEMQEL